MKNIDLNQKPRSKSLMLCNLIADRSAQALQRGKGRKTSKLLSGLALMLLVVAVFGLGQGRTQAAASTYLNFQARLLTSSGSVVPDGNYNIDFKIYNQDTPTNQGVGTCSSACLWEETWTGSDLVRVVNGYFSVKLGSVTAFPGSMNWDQQLWISMNIGGTGGSPSWDGEMTDSGGKIIQLTAVPLAFTAN